jgi:hypothetical protein
VLGQAPQQLLILKYLLHVRGAGRKEYRTSLIRMSCASPGRLLIGYYRGLASDELATAPSIEMVFDDRKVALSDKVSVSKMDSIDTGGSFDSRITYEPLKLVEAAAARDSIDIIESDSPGSAASPRIIKLPTEGLSKALESLRKTCGERKFFDAPAVESLDVPRVSGGR